MHRIGIACWKEPLFSSMQLCLPSYNFETLISVTNIVYVNQTERKRKKINIVKTWTCTQVCSKTIIFTNDVNLRVYESWDHKVLRTQIRIFEYSRQNFCTKISTSILRENSDVLKKKKKKNRVTMWCLKRFYEGLYPVQEKT